ncbi:MAG: hypothetical protein Q8Q13_02905 [bacterium]|nr:hypothetical protein [bacterium]
MRAGPREPGTTASFEKYFGGLDTFAQNLIDTWAGEGKRFERRKVEITIARQLLANTMDITINGLARHLGALRSKELTDGGGLKEKNDIKIIENLAYAELYLEKRGEGKVIQHNEN